MLLTLEPTYVYEESISFNSDIITYEDGSEHRFSRGTPRRSFVLRFLAISEATRDTLNSFYQARFGSASTFQWVNPLDNVTYNVRFASDSLEENNVGYNDIDGNIFNIECILIQVV